MNRNEIFILTIVFFLYLFFSFVSADVVSINSGGGLGIIINPASLIEGFFSANTINLTSCTTLDSSNSVYTLDQDLSSSGTCFVIGADNVTLDCQGHLISYSSLTAGYGLVNDGYDSLSLENCQFNLTNFTLQNSYGVYIYGGAVDNVLDDLNVTTTTISSSGNKYNYGVYFNGVYNSTLKDSNISTLSSGYLGYSNFGIYVSSGSNNTIDNNFILTNNYLGEGIRISSEDNNISNNIVKTLFESSFGITVYGSNNYFYNNSITTKEDDAGGDSSYGVYIRSGNNNIFRSNKVVTYRSVSYLSWRGLGADIDISNLAEGKPVWYNDSLNDFTFQGINFSNYGEVACMGCNNVTYDDVIIRYDGLVFGGTDNSSVKNSDIISNTSHGIYLFYSDNNSVDNTNISEKQNYVNAIKLRYSNNNKIKNSHINESANDYSVYLQNSDYNLFYNNLIDSYGSGYAVLFYGSTDYENFTLNTFNTVSICFQLDSSGTSESYFEENDFNCGGSYAVNSYRGSNSYIFKNNDYDGDAIRFSYGSSAHTFNLTNASNFGGFSFSTSTSNIGYLNWYLDVYVNDTFGRDVSGANVSMWDNGLNLEATRLTTSSGRIQRKVLMEYSQDSSGKSFKTNYTLNTTKSGYYSDSRELNMTSSKFEYITLVGTPPLINIISPNETNYTTVSIDFNVSVIEDENVSYCYYSINNQSNLTLNRLNDSYFWDMNDSLGPGDYNVTFSCNDTSGNWGFNSTNFTILDEAAISIKLSDDLLAGVKWNVFYLPADDLDAVGNNNNDSTDYYVNISATNTLVDLYVKADGDLYDDALDSLGLGNETYSVSTNNSTVPKTLNKTTMTTNYVLIGEDLPSSVLYMKFYLDAPGSQPAGVYKNGLIFKAVKAGEAV